MSVHPGRWDDDHTSDPRLMAQLAYEARVLRGESQPVDADVDPGFAETVRLLHHVFSAPQPTGPQASQLGTSADREAAQLPATFGRFVELSLVGQGAFGSVWKAFDPLLKRPVAIKVLHPELRCDPQMSQRFLREAQAAARLSHPGIVRVYEAGVIEDISYLAAEFVAGRQLSDVLREQKCLPAREAAGLIAQLADAVHHAHQHGVLHRDIKPENVLLQAAVTADGSSQPVARLSDFGLARISEETAGGLSRVGLVIGTPNYMAPEQLRGEPAAVGATADVYALGVVLYELLSGHLPRPGGEQLLGQALASRHIPPPRSHNPGVPRDLEAICIRCLAYEPEQRYPTAAALVDDLQRFLDGRPTWARPLSSLQRLQRWSRTHRGASLAAVVSLVSLLLAGGVVWKSYDDANQQSRVLSEAWLARQAANQDAVAQKKKYQQLALRNGLRTAYDLYEQGRLYAAARELQDLRARHPDDQNSSAAVLLGAELQERFEILGEFGKPLREVVPLPGRSQLALAGDSPHILLYDLEQQRVVQTLETPLSQIHALAANPDGRWLAAGGATAIEDDLARPHLIDLTSGMVTSLDLSGITTLESLAFSPAGDQLAAGFRYEGVAVGSLSGSQVTAVRRLEANRRNRSLAWIDQPQQLITQLDNMRLAVSASTDSSSLLVDDREVEAFAAIPGAGQVVASLYHADSLAVYSAASQQVEYELTGGPRRASCLAVSQDGQWIAAGYGNGKAVVWRRGATDSHIRHHGQQEAFASAFVLDSGVTDVCWYQDQLIAVGDDGRTVRWTPAAREYEFDTASPITAACFLDAGERVLLGFANGQVGWVQTTALLAAMQNRGQGHYSLPEQHILHPPGGVAVNALAHSPQASLVGIGFSDGSLRVYSADSGQGQWLQTTDDYPPGSERAINALCFSADARWIAWGSASNQIVVRSLAATAEEHRIALPSDVIRVQFVPGEDAIAGSGLFEGVRIFEWSEPKAPRETLGHNAVSAFKFNAATQRVLIGFSDGTLRAFHSAGFTEQVAQRPHPSAIRALDSSPELDLCLTIDEQANIVVSDYQQLKTFGQLHTYQRLRRNASHLTTEVHFSQPAGYLLTLVACREEPEIVSLLRVYQLRDSSSGK